MTTQLLVIYIIFATAMKIEMKTKKKSAMKNDLLFVDNPE